MNVGSEAGHGRWRSEQMSQLLERLLPGFLQILAMLLLVGGLLLRDGHHGGSCFAAVRGFPVA